MGHHFQSTFIIRYTFLLWLFLGIMSQILGFQRRFHSFSLADRATVAGVFQDPLKKLCKAESDYELLNAYTTLRTPQAKAGRHQSWKATHTNTTTTRIMSLCWKKSRVSQSNVLLVWIYFLFANGRISQSAHAIVHKGVAEPGQSLSEVGF